MSENDNGPEPGRTCPNGHHVEADAVFCNRCGISLIHPIGRSMEAGGDELDTPESAPASLPPPSPPAPTAGLPAGIAPPPSGVGPTPSKRAWYNRPMPVVVAAAVVLAVVGVAIGVTSTSNPAAQEAMSTNAASMSGVRPTTTTPAPVTTTTASSPATTTTAPPPPPPTTTTTTTVPPPPSPANTGRQAFFAVLCTDDIYVCGGTSTSQAAAVNLGNDICTLFADGETDPTVDEQLEGPPDFAPALEVQALEAAAVAALCPQYAVSSVLG